jgi:hypothetical protein
MWAALFLKVGFTAISSEFVVLTHSILGMILCEEKSESNVMFV